VVQPGVSHARNLDAAHAIEYLQVEFKTMEE
jgi:hypothetical protein